MPFFLCFLCECVCVSVVPLLPSSISVKCEAEGSRLNRLPGHKDHINSSNEALLSLSFIISVSPLNKLTGVTAALEGLLCPDSPFFCFSLFYSPLFSFLCAFWFKCSQSFSRPLCPSSHNYFSLLNPIFPSFSIALFDMLISLFLFFHFSPIPPPTAFTLSTHCSPASYVTNLTGNPLNIDMLEGKKC